MRVKFETAIDGINRYIDKEIYSNLNSGQEFLARVIIGRINENASSIKNNLMHNGFAKTLGFVDSDGMVDVDQVLHSIKEELERQKSICFEVPLMGKFTFKPEDVDVLYNEIVRGGDYENY